MLRAGLRPQAALICLALLLAAPAEARDRAQVRAFRATHPCPSTDRTSGPCPGWVVDHITPLCAGGPDQPGNMAWQERRASYRKDAEERKLCRGRSRH